MVRFAFDKLSFCSMDQLGLIQTDETQQKQSQLGSIHKSGVGDEDINKDRSSGSGGENLSAKNTREAQVAANRESGRSWCHGRMYHTRTLVQEPRA
jgi:hypothetical protein